MLERLKIAFTVRVPWRDRGRVGAAIRGFQATEADGVWHLQQGLARLDDPRQKALIFVHCLEEESHADAFAALWRSYQDGVFSPEQAERAELYPPGAPVWKSFAYVHVGERDATERFRLLRDALGRGPLHETLGRIVEDESGHVDSTAAMLTRLGAEPAALRRELWLIVARRLWERWLRAGKRVVDVVATVLLSAIYYALGGLAAAASRRRLQGGLVDYDNNRPKRL